MESFMVKKAKKKAAPKRAAAKKGGKKKQPQNKEEQTQRQIDKIQAEIDAGDTSPEKAQDLQNQKDKLARLQGGENVPDEPEA